MKVIFKYTYKVYFKLLVTFYNLVKFVVLPFKSKRILVVKLDAIGDYVLFRNMLACLPESEYYRGYKLSLLGNIAFKDLAETFDRNLIETFYWIDPNKIYAFPYKFGIILRIKVKAFDLLINPVHSGTEEIDTFINELGAKYKIGSSGDNINLVSPEIRNSKHGSYNERIPVPGTACFEFNRNREFMGNLLKQPCTQKLQLPFNLREDNRSSIIIFPGARHSYRRWSPENFAETIIMLNKWTNGALIFEICGSEADGGLAAKIIEIAGNTGNIINMTGKTNLIELVDAIGNSKLLISNETVAVHIGAAVSANVICISNGNHFGRFNPYPTDVSDKVKTFYPIELLYDASRFGEFADLFKITSHLDINLITPRSVANMAIEII